MSLRQEDMYVEGNHPQFNNSQYPHRIQQQPLRCANCDIDILWPPTVVQGKTYCCTGCAAGGPCNCRRPENVNIAVRTAERLLLNAMWILTIVKLGVITLYIHVLLPQTHC